METVYIYQSQDPPGIRNLFTNLTCNKCHKQITYYNISHQNGISYAYKCPCNKMYSEWVTVTQDEFRALFPLLFKPEQRIIKKQIANSIISHQTVPVYLYISKSCLETDPCIHYVIGIYRLNDHMSTTPASNSSIEELQSSENSSIEELRNSENLQAFDHGECSWDELQYLQPYFPVTFANHGTITDDEFVTGNQKIYDQIINRDYSLLERNVTL